MGQSKMKTLEFQGHLTADRTVEVPESIAKQLPAGQTFRVLIILPETEKEEQE
jgi:hypothetical protein